MMRIGIKPLGAAHVLRHSLATHMLAHGVSLQGIGEVLRHTSIESTAHYAKGRLSFSGDGHPPVAGRAKMKTSFKGALRDYLAQTPSILHEAARRRTSRE
jgi:DNA-binding transcriptional MerR regulator